MYYLERRNFMNNNRKYTPGEILFTIVFMIWFFGSIFVMVFLARNGMEALAIGVFGQYFLVFGIAAMVSGIKKRNFNPIFLIVPIVGIIGIAVSVIWQFGARETVEFIEENWWMALLAVFIIMGILLEVYAIYITVGKKRRSNQTAVATCIDILVSYDDEGYETYCPVYEAYVGGIMNRLCNNVYSRKIDVQIGDMKDIYVNEYLYGEFYNSTTNNMMGLLAGILGLLFIGMPLFGLFMMWYG